MIRRLYTELQLFQHELCLAFDWTDTNLSRVGFGRRSTGDIDRVPVPGDGESALSTSPNSRLRARTDNFPFHRWFSSCSLLKTSLTVLFGHKQPTIERACN